MTFEEATDRLLAEGVTLQEIAEVLGVAYTTARAFRLNPDSTSARTPPDDWARALARLATRRKVSFGKLAEELARQIDK